MCHLGRATGNSSDGSAHELRDHGARPPYPVRCGDVGVDERMATLHHGWGACESGCTRAGQWSRHRGRLRGVVRCQTSPPGCGKAVWGAARGARRRPGWLPAARVVGVATPHRSPARW